MRQPHSTADIIEIDVLDADPEAFGGSDAGIAHRPHRRQPPWTMPFAVVTTIAVAVVVFVWHPWQQASTWRTFAALPPAVAELTNQLLPAAAPGVVFSVSEPMRHLGANTPATSVGYVFAEPEATYQSRRWALFEAVGTRAANATVTTTADEPTVNGVPASLTHLRVRNQLAWGPVDGFAWRTDSNLLSQDEAVAFAEAVGVQQGQAAVRRSYDLAGLQPIGSVSAFLSAYALENALTRGRAAGGLEATVVLYAHETGAAVQVASVPAPPDALALAEFVFGDGNPTTVHGLPAVTISTRDLGVVVAWVEGGRLIAVTGRILETVVQEVAESVRPATTDEWAALPDGGD